MTFARAPPLAGIVTATVVDLSVLGDVQCILYCTDDELELLLLLDGAEAAPLWPSVPRAKPLASNVVPATVRADFLTKEAEIFYDDFLEDYDLAVCGSFFILLD